MPAQYPFSNDPAYSLWRKILINQDGPETYFPGEPEHSIKKKVLRNQGGIEGPNSSDTERQTVWKILTNQVAAIEGTCSGTAAQHPFSNNNETILISKILRNQDAASPYISGIADVPILRGILKNMATAVDGGADMATVRAVLGACPGGSGPTPPTPPTPRAAGVNLSDGLIAHWGSNPTTPARTFGVTTSDSWKDQKANIYDLSENGVKVTEHDSGVIYSNFISSSTSATYGHTDFLEQTDTIWRFGAGDFTVSLYAEYKALAATPRAGVIACSGGVGERSWSLAYDEATKKFIFSVSTDGTNWTHVATSGVTAARNVWHRVTFGRNGANIWISVNQEAKVETAIGTETLSETGHLIVFQEDSLRAAASFWGYIDEISIWDSALNADEIAAFGDGSNPFGIWNYTSLLSPTYGGIGIGRRSTTPATPAAVALPQPVSADAKGQWTVGDILILAVTAPNAGMGTWTIDPSWTAIFDEQYPADSNQIAAWWKRAEVAESNPTLALSAIGGYVAQIGVIRGAIATGNPIREVFGTRVAAQTNIDTLAYTPTSSNDFALHLIFTNDNLVFSNTEPLTPMFLEWQEPSTAGLDSSIFWARKVLPSEAGVLVPSKTLGAITGPEVQWPKVIMFKTS